MKVGGGNGVVCAAGAALVTRGAGCGADAILHVVSTFKMSLSDAFRAFLSLAVTHPDVTRYTLQSGLLGELDDMPKGGVAAVDVRA